MTDQCPITLPRAVLFDWDNTLVETWDCIHAALAATFDAMGMEPWSMADTQARVRQSLRDSFPKLFGERWQEARDIYYHHFSTTHLEYLRAKDGAAELLDVLAERGVYLGVVSNKTGKFLRKEAEALGWQGRFQRIIGATDAEADKPAVAPVKLALEPIGIEPGGPGIDSIWFVGDADVDLECAHAAGCVPILLGPAKTVIDVRFPPRFHFDGCPALSALVLTL
ncbi:phosphoglycolate phosphatase [uncultured Gammaproteobacteria bacterium]